MESSYFLFYAEANIVSIIILCILFFNDRLHSMRQEKQIWFNRTLIAHILYFVTDIGWAAVLSGQLPKTRALVIIFNYLNYIFISLIAYEWFMYMAASENMKLITISKQRTMCLLPMILSAVIMAVAYLCAPYFWIDEAGEVNMLYYPMMIAAPSFYLIAAFIFSMINASRTKTREERKLYYLIGIYPMTVILFGLLQVFVLDAPLFCFGCMIMMVIFYVQNLQGLVSVDALTRLNNRGQIDTYMDQTRFRENSRIYAMMMDIDRFKKINDTWGHAEGDRALVLVAETLKQTAGRIKLPMFLGRYGGDEFVIFLQNAETEEQVEQVLRTIRELLAEKQQENRLPYDLKITAGYDLLRDREDTLRKCLARADEKLYQTKRKEGILR